MKADGAQMLSRGVKNKAAGRIGWGAGQRKNYRKG